MDRLTDDKQELRRWAQERREGLSAQARREFSAAIERHVLASWAFDAAHTVMAYASMRAEVMTEGIVSAALRLGKRVVLPVCAPGWRMHAVPYEGGILKPNRFGVLEPEGQPVAPDEIELILVPGLLFSREGGRLGYGAGYYDRFLPTTRAIRAGLAFGIQIVDKLVIEEHDVRMHALVSDCGWKECTE